MSAPPLSRAVAASAAVHLAVAAGLLALAHPPVSMPPPLRVALLASPGPPEGAPNAAGGGARALPPPEVQKPPASTPPATPRPSRAARRSEPEPGPDGTGSAASLAPAEALVTPVQSDLWVLGAPSSPRSPRATPEPTAGGTGPPGNATAVPAGREGGDGPGAMPAGEGAGTGGSSAASLLAALSQRLAWSAERCAPAAVVRLSRRTVPGVPLHFCLDAAGRPSDVDLLGTTGSDDLDRAARDCVVPGALPLPPAPGCYTVEVRFPIRG